MRRIATAVVAGAVLAAPNAAAKEGPLIPSRVLGLVAHGKTLSVVKLNASTLKPVSRAAQTGSTDATYVARSPGRGRLAAFNVNSASIRFLNLDTMRWDGRVAFPGTPKASLWNFANRLVTLTATAEVIVVDPTRGRLASIRRIDGSLTSSVTTTFDRIVAVISPFDGIGPARLAVIDDTGRVRITPLPQIRAGSATINNASSFSFELPALAVDPRGKEAAVMAADGTIVHVRLDTLAMTVHSSRTPATARKNANGSSRTALWIGSDTIALTGYDSSYDGTREQVTTPAGLTLIDPRDWSARRLDADTSDLALPPFANGCGLCTGVLLAYGRNGVAGYSFDGAPRFRLFAGTQARPMFVAGSYAYFGYSRHYTIVNTWTGSVVRTVDPSAPTFVAAFAS
jgi:hypothetical protein